MIGGFTNVLRKIFLFSVLALVIAWPLQPQRANRQDRDPKLNPPADTDRASTAAPAQWARRYSANYYGLAAGPVQQTADGGYIIAGYWGTYDVGLEWENSLALKLDPQGTVEWATPFGLHAGWAADFSRDIVQTPDGGFVICGRLGESGYWVIKLTATGRVVWQKIYYRAGVPNCLQLTQDGGFIVAGVTSHFGDSAPYYTAFWVMKLSSDGEVEWQKEYHEQGLNEYASAAAQTPDGGYIVAGFTDYNSETGENILVLRLDLAGQVVWQRRYSEPGSLEAAYSVQPLPDGSYIVAGGLGYPGQTGPGGMLAMRLASDGNILWSRIYKDFTTSVSWADEILQTADGGFVMTNRSALVKLNPNGDIIWQRGYKGFAIHDVALTADGGFIFTGYFLSGDYLPMAAFKTDGEGIIAGCPFLHDPRLAVLPAPLTMSDWSPTVTPAAEGFVGEPFKADSFALKTDAICLPFFDLTIAAGPGGTTKPEPATHGYAGGTSVKVYALPDERHIFSYWSGDVPENKRHDNPVRIDMDDNKSIKANFARPNFQLTISAGAGGATDPTPGVHTYAGDTVVSVAALPDANHVFLSWTGDVPDEERGQNPVMIGMDSDKTVAANFLRRIFPPLDLRVETQENRSLFTVEHINILTWRPNSMNTGIIKYRVFELRDGNLVLLAEPAVGTETYWHRGVKEGNTYTYVVKAVGNDGREGEPATVTKTVS